MTAKEAIELNKNLLMYLEIENSRNPPDNQFSRDNIEALRTAISALEVVSGKHEIGTIQLKENEWFVVRYDPHIISIEHLQWLFDCLDKEFRQKSMIMPNNISTSIQHVSDCIILFGEAVKKLEEIYK